MDINTEIKPKNKYTERYKEKRQAKYQQNKDALKEYNNNRYEEKKEYIKQYQKERYHKIKSLLEIAKQLEKK